MMKYLFEKINDNMYTCIGVYITIWSIIYFQNLNNNILLGIFYFKLLYSLLYYVIYNS